MNKMKVAYYPGCTLETTAKEFDITSRSVCAQLGIELVEIPDWNCCGASSAHETNDYLAIALPARNLVVAEQELGLDVVIPCAACFNRLKAAEKALLSRTYTEFDYEGKIKVYDLLSFLAQPEYVKRLKKKVVTPLKELKAVAYYGCLLCRPPEVTDHPQPENPMEMETVLKAIGVECLPWSYKTDCCGASLVVARPDIVHQLVKRLYDRALEVGAECIVTACPLCHANLDMRQKEINEKYHKHYYLPIFYFTELMALAMGIEGTETWAKGHFVDPRPLLEERKYL
ncbi:MAG: CoB--CoM heterodisulfide reductase iron-sulfur subunit B family protein [Candidatus Desulfofervidaceae bacterium]|nr:CoB--CoM heterodisulfide reductase iron-sulfur subunit B family protein [Candidatus Desulfofervidaceae bacterium]